MTLSCLQNAVAAFCKEPRTSKNSKLNSVSENFGKYDTLLSPKGCVRKNKTVFHGECRINVDCIQHSQPALESHCLGGAVDVSSAETQIRQSVYADWSDTPQAVHFMQHVSYHFSLPSTQREPDDSLQENFGFLSGSSQTRRICNWLLFDNDYNLSRD